MSGKISKYHKYILLKPTRGKKKERGGGGVNEGGNIQIQIEGQPSILLVRGDPGDTSQ